MGAKNSKFEQSIASSDTTTTSTTTPATASEYQNSSSNPALYQKTPSHPPHHSNLVKRFKRGFSPSPSEHSLPERIDPFSDSSVSSFQKKTKKLLCKKKKKEAENSRQTSISIESGGERLSLLSATNTVEYLETLDPMTAAAERLSARYDETHERKRAYSFSAIQRQLESLDYNQDVERNLNMPQPTITSTIPAGTGSTGNSSRSSTQLSLKIQDVHPKINEEEWLNTKCASSSLLQQQQQQQSEKITGQEIVLDLFTGHSNESGRRKEKDRQQRMVKSFLYMYCT